MDMDVDVSQPELLRINIFDKKNTIININNGLKSNDRFIYTIFESPPAVDIQSVDFGYKKNVLVLKELSLKIPKGRIFGLLGSSGCGKTTLLRLVLGRLEPNKGSIKVFGVSPASAKSTIPGPGVGYMPQETALFNEFTITEILYYYGILYHMDMSKIRERIQHLKELLSLQQKERLIGQLSGGQQRLVSMAVTMFHKPPLLILDEPTVGVDSILRCRIWEYLEDICKNDGTTVVITTHYLEEATNASNVAYIESGSLLVQSNPRDLLTRYQCRTLEEAFLRISVERKNSPKREAIETPKATKGSVDANNTFIINLCSDQKKFIDSKHIRALLWRSQIRITRSPAILLLLLMLPLIQITLFCVCTGGKPKDIPIAIHEPDYENHLSHLFLEHIDRDLIKEIYFKDKHQAIESVRKGESFYAILFSQNFSDSLEVRVQNPYDLSEEELSNSDIKLYADMTNTAVSPFVHHSLVESSENFLKNYLSSVGFNPNSISLPFQVVETVYGSMNSSIYEFTAPGVIIATIHVTTMLFSSLLIVIERKEGHLDRALVAGVNTSEILIAHIIMIFLCVVCKSVLMMIFSFQIFDIPLRGSVLDAFLIILLQGLQGMSFGLFISVLSKEEAIALIVVFSVVFPMWFFSAVFWPIEAIPLWLRSVTQWAPLTQPIDALRSVLLRSWSLLDSSVALGLTTSLVYISVLLFLSFFIFRKSTH